MQRDHRPVRNGYDERMRETRAEAHNTPFKESTSREHLPVSIPQCSEDFVQHLLARRVGCERHCNTVVMNLRSMHHKFEVCSRLKRGMQLTMTIFPGRSLSSCEGVSHSEAETCTRAAAPFLSFRSSVIDVAVACALVRLAFCRRPGRRR